VARLVAALATVHNPFITAFPDAAPSEQADAVHAGFGLLRAELEHASPDWALVITNEHLRNAFYPYLPPFALGVAPQFQSVEEVRNAGLGAQVVPSDENVASQLLESVWDGGVDVAVTHDLLLDHGTMVPLHFLTPRLDLPIVHIHQATSRGPRPPLKRCYQLGQLIREFVETRPASERVALVGTGGLSHWVGTPRMGEVNAEWDQALLRMLVERRDSDLLSMSNAEIEAAGNGAHEVRNWVTIAGATRGCPAEVLGYVEHIQPWTMGSAQIKFHVQGG